MRRTVIAFVSGVAVGALGLLSQLVPMPVGVMRWRWQRGPEYFPPTPIVAAAVDIPAGAVISADQLAQRGMPDQFVVGGMLEPGQEAEVIGRAARRAIVAGEPMQASFVVQPGSIDDVCRQLVDAANAGHLDLARAKVDALRERLTAR